MRRDPTASERALWAALRSSQLGVGFRRQALVAGCIVDFLAPSRRLVVEVDGGYHRSPAQRRSDARRDRVLERAAYNVLRLPAELVLSNLPAAVQLVRLALLP
jgi:very-short-patch-repair endonuclease